MALVCMAPPYEIQRCYTMGRLFTSVLSAVLYKCPAWLDGEGRESGDAGPLLLGHCVSMSGSVH